MSSQLFKFFVVNGYYLYLEYLIRHGSPYKAWKSIFKSEKDHYYTGLKCVFLKETIINIYPVNVNLFVSDIKQEIDKYI